MHCEFKKKCFRSESISLFLSFIPSLFSSTLFLNLFFTLLPSLSHSPLSLFLLPPPPPLVVIIIFKIYFLKKSVQISNIFQPTNAILSIDILDYYSLNIYKLILTFTDVQGQRSRSIVMKIKRSYL